METAELAASEKDWMLLLDKEIRSIKSMSKSDAASPRGTCWSTHDWENSTKWDLNPRPPVNGVGALVLYRHATTTAKMIVKSYDML